MAWSGLTVGENGDVERMNAMLNESLKTLGIRYVFIISDTANSSYKERKKNSR
jgi:hypothetical protein